VFLLPPRLLPNALHGGLSGVGWTIVHLGNRGAVDCEVHQETKTLWDNATAHIDSLLVQDLQSGARTGPYDLLEGVVGWGVYLLERLPRQAASQGLELIVDHLERSAEQSQDGITWRTQRGQSAKPGRQAPPSADLYTLGVPRGITGVLCFLGDLLRAGIEELRVGRLLQGGVDWLLSQQRPEQCVSRYAPSMMSGRQQRDSRLGWCSGDLGIATVLHRLGRQLGREDWLRSGRTLLNHCVMRPESTAGVVDAPLCHGALGIAHVFNRMYQYDRDARYKAAAISWYERGLAMRQSGVEVGGFPAWSEIHGRWIAESSLLAGAIGAALALVSSMHPITPEWDRLLLLCGAGGD
jgi:lantibiotic biosynthesis protein